MSSVLKALKKLENEASRKHESSGNLPGTSPINAVDTKHVIHKQLKKIWFFNTVISTLVIAVILAGAGWFVLNHKPVWVKALFPGVSRTAKIEETALPEIQTRQSTAASAAINSDVPLSEKKSSDTEIVEKVNQEKNGMAANIPKSYEKQPVSSEETVGSKKDTGKGFNTSDVKIAEKVVANREKEVATANIPKLSEKQQIADKPSALSEKAVGSKKDSREVSAENTSDTEITEVEVKQERKVSATADIPKPPEKQEIADQPPVLHEKPALSGKAVGSKKNTRKVSAANLSESKEKKQRDPVRTEKEKRQKTDTELLAAQTKSAKKSGNSLAIEDEIIIPTHPSVTEAIADEPVVTGDPGFQLQALVWSEEPTGSFVVIDNHIIKTGEVIAENIIVTHIGADYIIFQQGNEKKRLNFRIK